MTVLVILGIIAAVAAIGWSCWAVHEYADNNYAYAVFSKRNVAIMVVPIVCFIIGCMFVDDGQTPIEAVRTGNLDTILMFAVSGLTAAGFFIYLTKETNAWIALFAVVVLFAIAVIIIVVLILFALSRDTKKSA